MVQVLSTVCLSIFIAGFQSFSLPDERKACRNKVITYIPDEYDFDQIHLDLVLDSSVSLNHVLVTRILQEECGFVDKEFSLRFNRKKRSHIARGIFRLSKWFIEFYQKSKKILKPELLEGIKKVVDKLHQIKTPIGKMKFAGIGKLFYEMWKDVDQVRIVAKDEHLDLMLEQTLRTSLQLLINNGELSEILLNHPNILNRIKTKIPTTNGKLLSEVTATNVQCQQLNRDSQAAIFLKLKIPRIQNITVEKCDDIGVMKGNTYQYYDLPTATFKRNDSTFAVDLKKCVFEDFVFCPSNSIQKTDCSVDNLNQCELEEKPDQKNFVRELQTGFVVFGEFTQVVSAKNGLHNQWGVTPHNLYHIIPQSGAVVSIGANELKQSTELENTVVRKIRH